MRFRRPISETFIYINREVLFVLMKFFVSSVAMNLNVNTGTEKKLNVMSKLGVIISQWPGKPNWGSEMLSTSQLVQLAPPLRPFSPHNLWDFICNNLAPLHPRLHLQLSLSPLYLLELHLVNGSCVCECEDLISPNQ